MTEPARSPFGAARPRAAVVTARERLRGAWRLVRGFAGEQAYERYVAHHAAHHPGVPPMGEREFWRRHTDRGDHAPAARCC